MSLFTSLNLGAGALLAQQAGVAVTGRNTANVNTEGYQRESIDLRAEPGSPLVGGVRTGDAYRSSDDLLSARERTQAGAGGHAETLAASLSDLEQRLTGGGGDLIGSIGDFFAGVGKLQSAPTDSALRQEVVAAAGTVAAQFRQAASGIAAATSEAKKQVTSLAEQASQLASQIATANRALATSNDPVLADQRDLAANKLAALVGGQARVDADGQMRFVLDGGAVLVDGGRAATLSAVTTGGTLALHAVDGVHDTDVTSQVAGGKVGGLLSFRNGVAAQAASDLDQLAYDFANQVNAVHRANIGLDGSTGRDLFVAPGAVAGAAAALTVTPAIVADPRALATRSPGAGPNDNGGVAALLSLRDAAVAAGGARSFGDEAIRMIGAVGSAAAQASADRDLQAARTDQLASARDSVSGVSQEDEMAKLAQFQHAAEAASKFISTVNDLLGTLIAQL